MEPFRSILKRLTGLENIPSPQSIKMTYQCEKCRDVGFLHPLTPDGKVDYGSTIPCRFCVTKERIQRALNVSSLDSTFKSFKAVTGTEDALKQAKAILHPATKWKMLLFYGLYGCGKTHLLEAISLELWDSGILAPIIIFPRLIGRLKNTFDTKNPQLFEEVMERYCSQPYLLIDDVGAAGSFTPWSIAQLERIILARYRANLFTVFTTNLDLKDIPQFIVSRFSDPEKGRIVLNSAKDYRPLK